MSAAANPYDPIGNFGENIKNTLQTFGQAVEDIGTLTGFNRISPYASFTYDYMGAGDKARKTGPEIYDAATEVKQRQDNVKKMLQQQEQTVKSLVPSNDFENKQNISMATQGLVNLGLNLPYVAAGKNLLWKGMRGLGSTVFSGSMLGSGIGELAANRDTQDIMSSVDAWRNLYKSTGEKLEKRQYLPALLNAASVGLKTTYQLPETAIDAIYAFHPEGPGMTVMQDPKAGPQIRRAAQAENFRNDPNFNQDISGFRQSNAVPEHLKDKRTFLETYTPSWAYGKDAPSLSSQQTPEVQLQMARRNVWQSRSRDANKKAITAFKTPEELQQYRSALHPTQQAEFDNLVNEIEYEKTPEFKQKQEKQEQ